MVDTAMFVEIVSAQVFFVVKSNSAHFNKFFAGSSPALDNSGIEMRF